MRRRALLAAVLPSRFLRILAQRVLLRARMPFSTRLPFLVLVDARRTVFGPGVRLGRGVRIRAVEELEIGAGTSIGARTRLAGIRRVSIGKGVSIGGDNRFQGPSWVREPGDLEIGDGALVTAEHFFDLTRSITLGPGTTVGGIRSSFWTHGAGGRGRGRGRGSIEIGRECHLGSDVRFGAGVRLPDRTLVGMGSVVVDAPPGPGLFIAGVPARVRGEGAGPGA